MGILDDLMKKAGAKAQNAARSGANPAKNAAANAVRTNLNAAANTAANAANAARMENEKNFISSPSPLSHSGTGSRR